MNTMNVVIAGTGKMALNIGLALLRQGQNVHWVSRSLDRARDAMPQFVKAVNRVFRAHEQQITKPDWSLGTIHDLALGLKADVIIESSVEDRDSKRHFLELLQPIAQAETLFLSNSSSILPRDISENLIGCHFFYPLELHPFVELIVPSSLPHQGSRVMELCTQLGWRCIIENAEAAFIVNRLLLPLQILALRLLEAGYDPQEVEAASITKAIPVGMLSMMDAIGFDVLIPSIRAYASRMVGLEQKDCLALSELLAQLLAMGKLGNKNKNGLLCGSALPWGIKRPMDYDFGQTANHSLRSALVSGDISMEDMQYVLSELWGSTYNCREVLQ